MTAAKYIGGEAVDADNPLLTGCKPVDSIDRYDGLAQFFKRRSRDVVLSRYSPTAIIGVAEVATCLAVAGSWWPWLKARQVLPHISICTQAASRR